MSTQRTDLRLNDNQKRILSLEKFYFEKLEKIITSKDFIQDLKNVERETKNNYELLSKIWNLKNDAEYYEFIRIFEEGGFKGEVADSLSLIWTTRLGQDDVGEETS